jgi:hypothetical protein
MRIRDNELQKLTPPPAPAHRGLATRLALGITVSLPLLLLGCQSIAGSPVTSQIRIIDASPDAPGLDIYEASAAVAYNLGFGNVTSYIPIAPGTYTLSADIDGTHTALTSAAGTLAASNQYTVLISNVQASIQEQILKDQSSPAPGGEIALRFLDESVSVGAVDIYLVPSGAVITSVAPILYAQTFGANSGYVDVPSGSYKIVAFPAGTTPIATTVATYTGNVVAYASGSATTIILLDNKILNAPALQVVTAADYASPGATS